MTTYESLSDTEKLLFDVRRSIRYHDRRKAFFTILHKMTSLVTILMAGSILYVAQSSEAGLPLILFSSAGAFLAGVDVLVNFSATANLYNDLKSRYIKLEIDIVCPTDEQPYDSLYRTRLMIEADEPPTYHALDILCHNEVVIAGRFDREELYVISFIQMYTANIFQWHNMAMTMKKLIPKPIES